MHLDLAVKPALVSLVRGIRDQRLFVTANGLRKLNLALENLVLEDLGFSLGIGLLARRALRDGERRSAGGCGVLVFWSSLARSCVHKRSEALDLLLHIDDFHVELVCPTALLGQASVAVLEIRTQLLVDGGLSH